MANNEEEEFEFRARLESENSGNDSFEKRYQEDKGYSEAISRPIAQGFPILGTYLPKLEAGLIQKKLGLKPEEEYSKDLKYQRYLDKRLKEDYPITNLGSQITGMLATPGIAFKGLSKLGFLKRLLASAGISGVEGAIDDPEYYKEAPVENEAAARAEQGKNAALWSMGTGGLLGGVQQLLGSRGTKRKLQLSSLGGTKEEAKALERTFKGGKEAASKKLEDMGIFSFFGLPPSETRMGKRIDKISNKLNKENDALEKELSKKVISISKTPIAERIKENLKKQKVIDPNVATKGQISSVDDYLDDFVKNKKETIYEPISRKEIERLNEFADLPENQKKLSDIVYDPVSKQNFIKKEKILDDLNVGDISSTRRAIQARANYNDPNYTQTQQLFDEEKARQLNNSMDSLMQILGKKKASKYIANREKLHALAYGKSGLSGKDASRATGNFGSSFSTLFREIEPMSKIALGNLIGSQAERQIPSAIQKLNIELPEEPVSRNVWDYLQEE